MPDFLAYDFMQRALAAGLLVAAAAATVGLFVVLRRLALLGDTLAHVALAGVAAGILLGVYPVLTGLAGTLAGALAVEGLRVPFRRYGELATAVILATSLGLAVVLLAVGRGFNTDLLGYLFGSLVTVGPADVVTVAVLTVLVVGVATLLFRPLFFLTLDEDLARASGLPVRTLNVIFALLTGATVAVTMRVVGVLLVSSLLVLPVATSLQLARSFRAAWLLSVLFAELAVTVGLAAAFYLDLPPGGTIVLTAVAQLLLAIAARRPYDRLRTGAAARRPAAE
ncbi:metal ABC transporter permease [Thermaerobacter sp. PB12/4term]|uniref:metal ABC transporter permease n=1 Tax=Thermaerobacter sp. PB12/4term TaxID=2293838 RepID=UPI000E3292D9|nr:metal ABC transporter permease [Thermaerobacter sp. PB12/4term]QIA27709.1 metal ABC transporter permease [Thermaerobacter sp. PB12/4term]